MSIQKLGDEVGSSHYICELVHIVKWTVTQTPSTDSLIKPFRGYRRLALAIPYHENRPWTYGVALQGIVSVHLAWPGGAWLT
jgi:hypothetical protein